MDTLTVLLLSVGLAMDSFTVSLCGGMTMNPVRVGLALRMALSFGLFQAVMPVLGWVGGSTVAELIASYDHWVAFALLAFIGGRMVREALQGETCDSRVDPASLPVLLTLSVATSIDALAVGLGLAVLDVPILGPVLTIGAITAALSLGGVYLGRRVGGFFQSRVQILGGLILIGIGLRILIEHLVPSLPGLLG
ncbi:MAG: manganese efflux pump [Chloroflexi bacterium]|nr:manganese efflux pump [Chloroflexota bacterium]